MTSTSNDTVESKKAKGKRQRRAVGLSSFFLLPFYFCLAVDFMQVGGMRCRSFTNVVIRVNYRKHNQVVTAQAGTARVFHRGPSAAAILLPISDFRFQISD
jgi:hypothetical protein